MSSSEPIEGKIARVLNTRELVINRGTEHGVTRGMIFEVLDPEGSEIPDPDTGEIIGSIFRPKVRVRVVVAEPLLAVARTYRTRRVNRGGTGGAAALAVTKMLTAPPDWVLIPETFKSDDAQWEKISEEQSVVKVGDPVRQVPRAQQQAEAVAEEDPPASS
jgi:hypothetical protein